MDLDTNTQKLYISSPLSLNNGSYGTYPDNSYINISNYDIFILNFYFSTISECAVIQYYLYDSNYKIITCSDNISIINTGILDFSKYLGTSIEIKNYLYSASYLKIKIVPTTSVTTIPYTYNPYYVTCYGTKTFVDNSTNYIYLYSNSTASSEYVMYGLSNNINNGKVTIFSYYMYPTNVIRNITLLDNYTTCIKSRFIYTGGEYLLQTTYNNQGTFTSVYKIKSSTWGTATVKVSYDIFENNTFNIYANDELVGFNLGFYNNATNGINNLKLDLGTQDYYNENWIVLYINNAKTITTQNPCSNVYFSINGTYKKNKCFIGYNE